MNQPRRQIAGERLRLRTWASQHVQCAIASLGSLWRARWGTALTAAVIGIALALPMAAYLVVQSIADVGERVDFESQVSLFLYPQLSNEDARTLADELVSNGEVITAHVITKEQGLAEFQKAAGVSGFANNVTDDNPLPAVVTLGVDSATATHLAQFADTLGRHKAVEFVQTDQDWVLRLDAFLQLARQFLWLLSLLLGGGVMLVVGNTLRLSIEARRAEIEIAKLFGASDSFVRRAFLYQGLFFGLSGAVVAWVLVAVAALALHGSFSRVLELYALEVTLSGPGSDHWMLLILAGTGLGWLGAWLSVGHHLRAIEPR
ncbi:MAG: cell division transport system permease protein [Gammaproteobacteria bacterium]